MGKKEKLILVLIFLLGTFLRFYKLDWGEGFFFHPDEYHIASAVNRLSFPYNMNPKLFSYGSFTVYVIYFSKLILEEIFKNSYFSPFLVGRFYSALFSTATIFLTYLISRRLFKKSYLVLVSVFLVATSPGVIQQAHFSTPGSILTFWMILFFFFVILSYEKKKYYPLYLASISLGFALATKIVALTLFSIILPMPFLITHLKHSPKKNSALSLIKSFFLQSLKSTFVSLQLLLLSFLVFVSAFPYSIIDYENFINTTKYEISLGRGEFMVFYTRQFINTIPVYFQLTKILPYTINPIIEFFFLISIVPLVIVFLKTIEKKRFPDKITFIWIASTLYVLVVFIPNAFIFAKWTRFIAPAFPIICITSLYFAYVLKGNKKKFVTGAILIGSIFSTVAFFSIYKNTDTRLSATKWINDNLTESDIILTETGNTLDAPLAGKHRIIKFDFYTLEENNNIETLSKDLAKADYFIVQSRRVFANHPKGEYPITANFYSKLFKEELGYTLIDKIDSFPSFTIAGQRIVINDEKAEETWSVFDHPVIRIYKNNHSKESEYYETILKNK